MLKLHKYAAIFCGGLFIVSLFLVGWDDPEISNLGEDLIVFSLGLYIPFYCLRSFYLGKVNLIGYAESISKEEQAPAFWLLIALYLLLAISALNAPFK